MVEFQFSKLNVASSSLVARSKCWVSLKWLDLLFFRMDILSKNIFGNDVLGCIKDYGQKDKRPCGSVVEHSLGKGEVAGPIPAMGTIMRSW